MIYVHPKYYYQQPKRICITNVVDHGYACTCNSYRAPSIDPNNSSKRVKIKKRAIAIESNSNHDQKHSVTVQLLPLGYASLAADTGLVINARGARDAQFPTRLAHPVASVLQWSWRVF